MFVVMQQAAKFFVVDDFFAIGERIIDLRSLSSKQSIVQGLVSTNYIVVLQLRRNDVIEYASSSGTHRSTDETRWSYDASVIATSSYFSIQELREVCPSSSTKTNRELREVDFTDRSSGC